MKSCIFTVIKNEHIYLDEWIKYHLNIGIDYIIIAEDCDSKTHKDIAEKYNNVILYNIFEFFDNDDIKNKILFWKKLKCSIQETYLYWGLLYIKNNYNFDWCFVIDIDEFITVDNKYKNVNEVLSLYENYDSVILQWQNYGANGLVYMPNYKDNGIIETYLVPTKFTNIDKIGWFRNVKTVHHMTNYTKDSYNSGHIPDKQTNWCRTDFSKSKDPEKLIYDNIYIRHYITKSWEEYVIKLKVRGMFNKNHRNYKDFFDLNPDMVDKQEELIKIVDDIINKNKEKN